MYWIWRQGLPPALVINGENDGLCDEGEAYARKLLEAGVRVTAVGYHGTIHDFGMLNAITEWSGAEGSNRTNFQYAKNGIVKLRRDLEMIR